MCVEIYMWRPGSPLSRGSVKDRILTNGCKVIWYKITQNIDRLVNSLV